MKTLLALALLAFAIPAEAGPLSWAKRQVRDHPLRTQLVFAGVASGIYAEGLHQCRIVNVENCQEHYGAAWGGYSATVGLNLVNILIAHKMGGKQENIQGFGGSLGVLGWGAYQWHGGLNKFDTWRENETHPDFSRVVFVHR